MVVDIAAPLMQRRKLLFVCRRVRLFKHVSHGKTCRTMEVLCRKGTAVDVAVSSL